MSATDSDPQPLGELRPAPQTILAERTAGAIGVEPDRPRPPRPPTPPEPRGGRGASDG